MVNEIINRKPDYLRVLIYGFIITLSLYFGRTLFIPFSFALFLSIIIYPICKWFEKLGMARYLAILISIIIVLLPIIGLVLLVIRQFFIFSHRWSEVQEKLLIVLKKLYFFGADFLGMPLEEFKTWIKSGLSGGSADMILPLVKDTIAVSSVFIILLFIIPIYVFLILYYRNIFVRFISLILPGNSPGSIRLVLNETVHTYYNFIKGMSIVYVIVGLLNSIGLYFLGIPDPFFFGFITSILTIIPYVGIIAGAIVPVAIAWITYDSIYYPLGVIAVFTFVQIIEANLIFPLAVGNRLELNPLVVLLVVIAGGIIWGVSGMILFIPFIGILKIISHRIPSLQPISVLLGRDKDDRLPD
jgi:predicted PurR-regulated permease PerM